MLFDSHAHLTDKRFKNDRYKIIKRMEEEGFAGVINVGYDKRSSFDVVKLAEEEKLCYAAVGMHPHDARLYDEEFEKDLKKLLNKKKVVALGEIGLDYHYDNSPRDTQRKVFERQIDIAKEYKKPVIIHSREATKDTFDILKANFKKENKGVMHSYSSSKDMAREYMDIGMYISFSGVVTFKNARKVRESAEYVPLDRMLIETDSPYLTPAPHRGERNSPLYVRYVAEMIARIKKVSYDEVVKKTCDNAKKLFSIN